MAGIDADLRQRLRYVHHHGTAARPQVVEGPRDDLVHADRAREQRQRPGLQPAHVQQVIDEAGQPVQRFVGRGEQFVAVGGGPVHLRRAQAGDGRLGRGQRGAQVVADRREQRGAHPVGLGDRLGRLGLGGQPQLLQGRRRVGRERPEHAPVGGGQRAPAQRQRQRVGDRHLDVRVVGRGHRLVARPSRPPSTPSRRRGSGSPRTTRPGSARCRRRSRRWRTPAGSPTACRTIRAPAPAARAAPAGRAARCPPS